MDNAMKCFAFDLGKVLFDFDYAIALKKIKSDIKIPTHRIIHELFYNNFAQDFEKGLMGAHEFYKKFCNAFNCSLSYWQFTDAWCNIFSLNREVAAFVKKISGFYPIYLISNINELHFDYLQNNYPEVFSVFNGLILSYKVKSIKPEKRIYEALKEKSGCNYENIFYIDDRKEFIEEARRFDIKCINFVGLTELKASLKAYGIVIPAD
ncbi:MAG: HAD hydrolase-like protein [Candidatus Omnitrophica bacterium]|jgi:putative hydrolase of the HAD superfamily|nr:HAD hydrolase-like protein [Candidatus Omnitrophota bacterium]